MLAWAADKQLWVINTTVKQKTLALLNFGETWFKEYWQKELWWNASKSVYFCFVL